MYEFHFQLQEPPFEGRAPSRYFFPSDTHQGALLKLRYVIEQRPGAAVLSGAPGLGKTMLIDLLWEQLPAEISPRVHLVFPQMPASELVAYLGAELDTTSEVAVSPTMDQSVRAIRRFLSDNARHGRHAVVVVDEAHLITDVASLEALRLLLNFETDNRPDLTLLLVGQTGVLSTLKKLPALNDRIAIRCILKCLSADETAAYVRHRLDVAGGSGDLFEPAACEAIHHFSRGSPRKINRLADLALLLAYADQQTAITANHIEAVAEDLAVGAE
jgi:type II secretory pathway predicted ATPase ExeA